MNNVLTAERRFREMIRKNMLNLKSTYLNFTFMYVSLKRMSLRTTFSI